MAALKMDTACDLCGGDAKKCEEEQERQAKNVSREEQKTDAASLAYDASKEKNSK